LYVPPAVVLVILLGTWQGITVLFNVPSYILPSPVAVAEGFVTNASELLTATYYTLRDALAGFALSIIVGVLIAMILAQSRMLERAISPYATMLQTIPIIAIAPIINLLIGANEAAVSLIAFIIAVFPIISNTTLGLTSVDHNLLNLFQMYNASRWQMLWKLRLPNALPYLLAGVRISSGLAVIGAFVGEVFAGTGGDQGGLGYIILVAGNRMQMDVLIAAALLSAALGIAIFLAVNAVNYWILHNWHESATRREN
jgi:NitT/TauT family transport system permease protein